MVVPKAARMVGQTAESWVVYWAESWAARKVAQWVGSKGPMMAVWWVASWVDT